MSSCSPEQEKGDQARRRWLRSGSVVESRWGACRGLRCAHPMGMAKLETGLLVSSSLVKSLSGTIRVRCRAVTRVPPPWPSHRKAP